ncbi:MAG TPA: hypothetical protein VMC61_03615, partial [Methanocella sp.]|nr:hypothetical protein [Methanocella sp.]
DNSKVIGHVVVLGAAFIRPGVMFGSLDVGGLIEIQGKPPSKHIKGKMVVNDDMDYPEAPKKSEAEALRKPAEKQAPPVKAPAPPQKTPTPKAPSRKAPDKKAAKGKQQPAPKKKKASGEKPKDKGFFGLLK